MDILLYNKTFDKISKLRDKFTKLNNIILSGGVDDEDLKKQRLKDLFFEKLNKLINFNDR